jgi:DNA mismatch repair protein MutS
MLIDEYFKYQIRFEKKYGEKTIVLMEVGSFFEFYGVSNKIEKIGDAKTVCELLNIQLTRRNKSILENNRKNALMAGFPGHSMKRFINVLLQNNYTIVLVEQTTPPPNPTREITKIISPGTYIDEIKNNDANYIVSILINEEKCYNTNVVQYSIGLCAIDLTTGGNTVYELYSCKNDEKVIFEEVYRFVESFSPKEILIIPYNMKTLTKEVIISYINTNERKIHYIDNIDGNMAKITYQNEFLNRVFPDVKVISPIEYLNLEQMPNVIISYIQLLQFSYEHDNKIIDKIEKPDLWDKQKHMVLYNNTIYQLNIISYHKEKDNNCKYNSLYDVIKFTETPMGSRKLKYNLLNPIKDSLILKKRYKLIEDFMVDNLYMDVNIKLKDINDIERLHRKIALGSLHPHEFYGLDYSYKNIVCIIDLLFKNNNKNTNIFDIKDDVNGEFNKFIKYYEEIFNIDELAKNNLNSIQSSFFKEGYDSKLDNTIKNIKDSKDKLKILADNLSTMIEKNSDYVKVETTEKEGYYLQCTKKRCDSIRKKYAKFDSDYKIKNFTSYVKIRSIEIDKLSNLIISNHEKLKNIVKSLYLQTIREIYIKFGKTLREITTLITDIDLIHSHCKCVSTFNYTKPIIVESDTSFVEAKELRHPLIERLSNDTNYIPNDITIGKDYQGILLYGVNGVGKSALSKALGLNVVMAQMGMYVPSKEFVYAPYKNIFTRISGDDNIFKGQSSFVVEMNELRSILKYSDKNSLVLGDEVCKGTEDSSATAIVASAIQAFSKKKVNFILATHLHKLYELDTIKEISNVNFMHLDISYDTTLKKIIYGRK